MLMKDVAWILFGVTADASENEKAGFRIFPVQGVTNEVFGRKSSHVSPVFNPVFAFSSAPFSVLGIKKDQRKLSDLAFLAV